MGGDRWSAAGLALFAIAYLLAARRYPLDTLAAPGPGVVPMLAGLALLGAAVALFVISRQPPDTDAATTPATGNDERAHTTTLGALVLGLSLVVYAALLPALGFIASSFALVVLASRLMGAPGWWRPAALGVGVTAVGYLLFGRWLGVPLP